MEPEDVRRSYDSIADRWASDRFPGDYGIEQHRRAMAFLDQGRRALDIGCGGSGRIADLLLDQGFDVDCLDISEKMLELARRRHPELTFHRADICTWEFPHRYDFVSAWDSIWHVPLEEHARALARVLAGLSPGGVCIFTTGGVDEPSETHDHAMGTPMYHSAPGLPSILELVADAGCVCRHLEYDQLPELHVYLIVQKVRETAVPDHGDEATL